ncbi:MAG: YggS family pyridoxal phosphate-dependent enzyme [Gammaproteobacteria bacterium]|nr:YggS family pyridoxal phosphate-dependent enzyme [Gammaproteobacteria bacterium]MCW8923456.1 YggS family pyridoxal phosphate-dependent enzyme [Gammaproteobacteria bacterium]
MGNVASNIKSTRERIQQLSADAGRAANEVKLIAVSKTRSLNEVEQAIAAGQIAFGENTVQDALTKIPLIDNPDLEWHFIGHLQSKKSKQVAEYFQWIHTVDSMKLAQKLSVAMQRHNPDKTLNCLLQVNVSAEESKSGLSQEEAVALLAELVESNLPNLAWRGLMTIGVQGNKLQTRKVFSDLRKLCDQCQQQFKLKEFDQLSMGMSGDYAIAIEEGATMVRIGTELFGNRE